MCEHLPPSRTSTSEKLAAEAAGTINLWQLGDVRVGRELGIRPASDASAKAGLLERQRT